VQILRGHIRAVLVGVRRRVRHLGGRKINGDETPYRSPQEIALQNAADSLGVTLGEDYLGDLDLDDIVDLSGTGDPSRVDAFREELLTFIEGQSIQRRRRRRARALKVGVAGASIAVVVLFVSDVIRVPQLRQDHEPAPFVGDAAKTMAIATAPGLGRKVVTTMPAVGGGELVHSAYYDLYDMACSSTAWLLRGIIRREGRGGCMKAEKFARALSRESSFFTSVSGWSDYVLVSGHGRSDLERIVADDSEVRVDSTVSNSWRAPGGFDAKAFLARIWRGPNVRFASVMHIMADSRTLGLTAVSTDGDKSSITSFDEALHGRRSPTEVIAPIPELKYEDCVMLIAGEKPPPGRTPC